MSHDFTVHRYGTDSSGRGIYLTAFMHDWLQGVADELGWTPVIVQGAFMTRNGGGASASSGYHDEGGCVDLRTRDLSKAQVDDLVRVCRDRGGAAWRRDQSPAHGGMDPHCHVTLGSDEPLSPGARISWDSYLTGGDGIAGPGADYEYRPDPLVTIPPEDDMTPEQSKKLDGIATAVASLADMVEALAEGNEAIKRRITKAKKEVLEAVEAQS